MIDRIINGIPFDASAIEDDEGNITYDYTLFSADIANWLSTYFSNGVLVPKGEMLTEQLQVTKTSELSVSIAKGNILINGRTGFLTSPYELAITPADTGKQRIDRILIELNLNKDINEFRPVLSLGDEVDSKPVPANLIRSTNLKIYQMSLAKVLVTENGIQSIIDERPDDAFCGISQVLIGVKPPLVVTGDSAGNISYDGSSSGLSGATVQDAIDELAAKEISKTLLAESWGSDFTQTLTISGFTETMKAPIIDIVPSSVDDLYEWGKIWKIETGTNSLKFYAIENPKVNLSIIVKVVR